MPKTLITLITFLLYAYGHLRHSSSPAGLWTSAGKELQDLGAREVDLDALEVDLVALGVGLGTPGVHLAWVLLPASGAVKDLL